MIRWAETLPALAGEALPLCRVRALWECYGAVPFLRFYVGEAGSAVAVMDGQAIVHTASSEREEVALFLGMQPDIRSLLTDRATAVAVAAQWEMTVTEYPVMRCDKPQTVFVTETLRPRELYAFLQPLFPHLPPFEVWYPDVCYRQRHGRCRVAALRVGGKPASCAMTVAEWHGGALIGGVATAPEYRRQGLAARCVGALAATLQQEGRQVYICPKNEGAQRLYATLGFTVCDSVAVTERT